MMIPLLHHQVVIKIKFYFSVKGALCCKGSFDTTNDALDAKIESIKKSMKLV